MNPFGTLFNPASIADNLDNLITGKSSYSAMTSFTTTNCGSVLTIIPVFHIPTGHLPFRQLIMPLATASAWLQQCDYLLLTFGTAWAYLHKQTGKLVANCHKLPAASFTRVFLEPADIIARYDHLLRTLKNYNPDIRVIFTLSPVRHWSDGAVNNQLSKSVLHYSIHEILKRHNQAFYFPAYEIFMDELARLPVLCRRYASSFRTGQPLCMGKVLRYLD